MRAGFEWFVAWRYLRTRGRRASIVPLMVGVFMAVSAAGFFWLGLKEAGQPSFKYSGAPDWRRVYVLFTTQAAFVGAAFMLFGTLRRRISDRELLLHGLVGGLVGAAIEEGTRPEGEEQLHHRRVSWAPPLAGLALFVPSAYALYEAEKVRGPATPRFISLIPSVEPLNAPWQLAFEIATAFFIAAAAGALALAVLRIVRYRLSGARPRSVDEARVSGALGPLVASLVLIGFGALLRYVVQRPQGLEGFALRAGLLDWVRLYQAIGLAQMVLGVLVAVFGLFYSMQSIFTTISNYGVFLGTWALVVALSVMNGFEVDLRQKILGSNAHVLVTKEDVAFGEWRATEEMIGKVPGVVAHTPYKQSEVVIAANSNYNGVIIKGIDPHTVGKVTDLEKNLEHGAKLERLWPILDDGGVGAYSQRPDGGVEGIPEEDDEPPPIFDEPGAGGEGDAGAAPAPAPAEDEDEPPVDFSGEGDGGDAEEAAVADGGPLDTITHHFEDGGPGGFPTKYLPSRDSDLLGIGTTTIIESAPPRERPLDPRVADLDGILVGRECAKNLHLYVGQEVQVVSPLGQDTPAGQIPRVRNFRVAGIFYSGMYEYDTKYAYVTLPALQSFLSLGDEVDGIEIKIRDHDDTRPVVRALEQRLGPEYRVQDWKEINRNLFSALKLEKIAMFLVLTIIILVASFSIVSNLIMVVVEKAKEIAILKALGASDGGVMRVFMIEGSYIGALGTAFGISLGVATCVALERFGLPLDPDVYYIDKLPVAMDPVAISLVAFAGLAISFIATIYPSYVAAKLRPVDGLRYE